MRRQRIIVLAGVALILGACSSDVLQPGVESAPTTAASPATTIPTATMAAPTTTVVIPTTDSVVVADQPDAPSAGYNLFAPLRTTTTYLMDNDGNLVHSWDTGYTPGNAVYLLESGELLHTGGVRNATFSAGGAGGAIQLIDWDGNVTWEYEYSSAAHLQHHDVEMLPNGNVLMIAWQYKTGAEALSAGRDPTLLDDGELWPGSVIEVQPTGPTLHSNAVDYNAELDQIVLSIHSFSEIWVIDHSTTTAEAAGHTGGESGKGGDLLYRWGNPRTYGAGTAADQQLFGQHDSEWIAAGLPGEGNILIFNNGQRRPGDDYSEIVEIVTPVDPDGTYSLTADYAYGPEEPAWVYTADPATSFFAEAISGAQRLPNGNTLTCNGGDGYLLEVTPQGETVWEHELTDLAPNGTAVFRVERYPPDYAGFDGTPLDDE